MHYNCLIIDDEIAISALHKSQSGKDIGDETVITQNGQSQTYLITGLLQSMNDNGLIASVTLDGMHRLQPKFEPQTLYVYMEDGAENETDVEKLINNTEEDLIAQDGNGFTNALNMAQLAQTQLGSYDPVFLAVTVAILIISED